MQEYDCSSNGKEKMGSANKKGAISFFLKKILPIMKEKPD